MTFDARAAGASCDRCPLKDSTPVPPESPRSGRPKFIIIGEGPGKFESLKLRPFCGYSGRMLDAELEAAGLDRREAHVTNAVLCFGGSSDDKELEAAIPCCAPRLARELAALSPDTPILSLGAGASKVTIGKSGIQKYRGFVWSAPAIKPSQLQNAKRLYEKRAGLIAANKKGEKKKASKEKVRKALDSWEMLMARAMIAGRTVMPTVHPAFILRGADVWLPVMRIDLRRLARLVNKTLKLEGEGPFEQTSSPRRAAQLLRKLGDTVTVDIETDNVDPMRCAITCVGVADVKDPSKAVIIDPWNDKKHSPVLAKALAKRTCVTHNGPAFDNIALKLRGITYAKNEDTLVGHRVIASHMPQSLAHVASVFCLYGNTPVILANGRREKINKIVANRAPVDVLSYGPNGIELKRVIGWHRRTDKDQKWIQIRTSDQAQRERTRAYGRGLIVTPEHEIYTLRGLVRADEITTSDVVAVEERALSKLEFSAFIGTILGDSSIAQTSKKHRRSFVPTAALVGSHKTASGLAQAKVTATRGFIHLCATAIYERGYSPYPQTRYATISSRQVKNMLSLTYDQRGRRRITIEALETLGGVGLAWWIADDGSVHKKGFRIATNGFSPEDVELARDWLTAKFGPVSMYAVTDHPKQYTLGIRNDAAEEIGELIAPYMFPCVRYKLPTFRKWPRYVNRPLSDSDDPLMIPVTFAGSYTPADWKSYMRENSYCLTVKDNHNFFTSTALVANCDAEPWKLKFKSGEEKGAVAGFGVAKEDLAKYNAYDVRLDALAWTRMQPELSKEYELYHEDMAMAELYTRMQMTGIRVDQARRAALSKKLRYRSHALVGEMRKLLDRRGFAPSKPNDIRKALFGQLKAPIWLAPLTPTGLPSTAAIVLENLREQETRAGKLADFIIRWRSANDSRSEYLDGIHIHTDGCIHPTWKQVETGRPATRNPNVLNLPRMAFCKGCGVKLIDGCEHGKKKIVDGVEKFIACKRREEPQPEDQLRDIYVCRPDHKFVYFDLAQAEMRFAAAISADPEFIKSCEGDIHLENACILFPDAADKIRADPKGFGYDLRQIAKSMGFAVAYLAEAPTVFTRMHANGYDVAMDEVEAMLDNLHTSYRVYYKYCEDQWRLCQTRGWLRIPFSNRIRYVGHFPKINQTANTPVQGGVAGIMNKRLLLLEKRKTRGAKLIYYWYDAAIYDTPVAEVADMERIIKEVWAEPIVVTHNGVSFIQPIDFKVGERLSDF